jgi:hypothetical protein
MSYSITGKREPDSERTIGAPVIEYVVEEVRRQHWDVTKPEGIERVGWMLNAWCYAMKHWAEDNTARPCPTMPFIEQLGTLVDVNHGFRTCGVQVLSADGRVYVAPDAREVPRRLKRLLKLYCETEMTPLEFYREYELIHPFADGNGRSGKILHYGVFPLPKKSARGLLWQGEYAVMQTIYPTHTCFDDAIDLMCELLKVNPKSRNVLRVVHAICRAPDGHLYAHAWLLDTESQWALFTGIQEGERRHFVAPVDEFERDHEVQESVQYTPAEVVKQNFESGHYGPWIEKYRELCHKKGEPHRILGAIPVE